MAWAVAQVMSPIISGQVVTFVSFNILWWLTAALCLLTSVGVVVLYRFNAKKITVAL
jgi:hypothetical protein